MSALAFAEAKPRLRAGRNLERAGRAWGRPLPEWVQALAEACDEGTQAGAARTIGYSPATVNQVLAGTYKGNLEAVEGAVRGAYLEMTVACPVLREIPRNRCLAIQRQPLASTSPLRVRLWRACRSGCPNSRIGVQLRRRQE